VGVLSKVPKTFANLVKQNIISKVSPLACGMNVGENVAEGNKQQTVNMKTDV
jgi:hypothetical protein